MLLPDPRNGPARSRHQMLMTTTTMMMTTTTMMMTTTTMMMAARAGRALTAMSATATWNPTSQYECAPRHGPQTYSRARTMTARMTTGQITSKTLPSGSGRRRRSGRQWMSWNERMLGYVSHCGTLKDRLRSPPPHDDPVVLIGIDGLHDDCNSHSVWHTVWIRSGRLTGKRWGHDDGGLEFNDAGIPNASLRIRWIARPPIKLTRPARDARSGPASISKLFFACINRCLVLARACVARRQEGNRHRCRYVTLRNDI